MKRAWMTFVGVFALCLVLMGCGNKTEEAPVDPKADFVGTWEVTSMAKDGETTDQESLDAMKAFGLNLYLELAEDGSAKLENFGNSMEGTWTATEVGKGTLTLQGNGVPMVLDDGHLTVEQNESKLEFEQIDPSQKASGMDLSAVADDGSPIVTPSSFGGDDINSLGGLTEMDITVADDELFTIKVLGKGDYLGDPAFFFEVANKTGLDATMQAVNDTWSVNGSTTKPVIMDTIPANETMGTIIWFDAAEVGSDVGALHNIMGQIRFYNGDDTIAFYEVTID